MNVRIFSVKVEKPAEKRICAIMDIELTSQLEKKRLNLRPVIAGPPLAMFSTRPPFFLFLVKAAPTEAEMFNHKSLQIIYNQSLNKKVQTRK